MNPYNYERYDRDRDYIKAIAYDDLLEGATK